MCSVTPQDIQEDAIPKDYKYSLLLADPKSKLKHFLLVRTGKEKNRKKIWIKTSESLWRRKTSESRSRIKFYNQHLSVFSTNRMWSPDHKARFKIKTLHQTFSDEAMLYQFKLVPAFSIWSLPSLLQTKVSVERNLSGLPFHPSFKWHCYLFQPTLFEQRAGPGGLRKPHSNLSCSVSQSPSQG